MKTTVLALALLGAPILANAAGFGKMTVLSALGQPLRAEIDISATKDEISSVRVNMASSEQFRQQGVEYTTSLSLLRLSVEKRANGQPYVRVTTERPLNEPFMDMLVEMTWASGRLLREYTFLLDPPGLPQPVAITAPAVSGSTGATTAPVYTPAAPETVYVAPPAPTQMPTTRPGKQPKVKAAIEPKEPRQAKVKAAPDSGEAAPAPTPAAEGGATRAVKRGDTLGKIASETAPEGVSLDQMLIAIFNANRDAFDGDNINRLKTGKILNIPDRDAAVAVPQPEAKKTVAVHAQNFNAYRQKLAGAVADQKPAESAGSQSSSGKITPKVEDKTPPAAAGKDKLEVSRTETAKDAKAAKMAEEERIAKDKALKEANSRVAELEKNVADLKKLNELKSKNLAEAEKKSKETLSATDKKAQAEAEKKAKADADKMAKDAAEAEKKAKADAEKKAKEDAAAEKKAKEEADKKAAEDAKKAEADKKAKDEADKKAKEEADKKAAEDAKKAAESTPPPEGAKPPEVAPDAKPVEAASAPPPAENVPPPAKKKIVLPPPPEPEPSFMEENGPLVFGGIGLLALLGGFFGYREWKRRKGGDMESPSQFGEANSTSSVFGTTGGQSVDTNNVSLGSSFSQTSLTGNEGTAGVDPVAEADVYMAYGRDAQAEEILLEALKSEPTRHAVHLKLLELYAARKSTRPFEEVARDLYQQTGGAGNVWEKAAALGRNVDPTNPLYGGEGAAAAATEDTGAFGNFGTSTVIMPPGSLAKMANEPVLNPDADAEMSRTRALPPVGAAAAAGAFAAVAAAEEDGPALDFDLDLGSGDSAAPAAEAAAEEPAVLDFDLDLGASAAADTDASMVDTDMALDLEVPSISPAPANETSLDLEVPSISPAPAAEAGGLDIEFDLGTPIAAEAPAAPAAAAPAAGNGLDFDFNLDTPAAAPAASEPDFNTASTLIMDAPLDIPGAEPEPVAPPMDLSGISLDLDTGSAPEAAGTDAENPEVTTKLELAQAYEEMGDKEGMRELLQEVLAEGTAAQQEVARSKLAQHGL